MNYQEYQPHPDLASLVKCYWTLDVPATSETHRQRILLDGYLEMAFILGDDIKRYTSEDAYIIQPRAMVLGQITEPFFIEPTGYVDTFAITFYPDALAHFVSTQIQELSNRETSLTVLFDEEQATILEQDIIKATDTPSRIAVIEDFLFEKLSDPISIDNIVKTTLDTMFLTCGTVSIKDMLKDNASKRRQLERKFKAQVGMSPKQLCKVIRLQTVFKMMLHQERGNLSQFAYEGEYFDQAHFIKDFKEFTGMTPKEFLKFDNEEMTLSLQFYK